jgi:hypothetical protein
MSVGESRIGRPLLSKSKYLAGLQCPRLLWVHYNDAGRLAAPDASTIHRFDQGHLVGSLAQRLYPNGITIDWELGFDEVLRRTQQSLAARRPIFEAAFSFEGAFTRADVLVPVGKRQWDVVEVKSASNLKDQHLDDVAFQRHVYEGAGLAVRRCYLAFVDTSYVREGEVDPESLFKIVNVTREIGPIVPRVARRVRRLLKVIGGATCPEVEVGRHCYAPYTCPLEEECWAFLPERSVLSLRRGGDRPWTLLSKGVLRLADIPSRFPLTDKHRLQVRCARSGKRHVDRDALRRFLDRLEYPLHFLDFETAAVAVPLWSSSRPYEQVPFQYSLHVQRQPGGKPRHVSFLAKGQGDPRPRLLASLRRRLGSEGSIVAHHASFERQVLAACAAHFPDEADWIEAALRRVIDLEEPFRKFVYYHPDQEGSTSLKLVAPAVAGASYDDLAIADGQTAAQRFLVAEHGECPRGERTAVRQALKDYCCRDTEVMVQIVERLRRIFRGGFPGVNCNAHRLG